uniref:SDR family NAD(P)-dependent oxidoreductase n=1 Tax=Halorussus litoreus TaxID=1710536 RepID=UPI0013009A9B
EHKLRSTLTTLGVIIGVAAVIPFGESDVTAPSDDHPTALVTGAASGIGRALAAEFARDGHHVVLVDVDEAGMASAAADLEANYGVETTEIAADLSERGAAREVYESVREEGLTVDALVNNAGFGVYGEFTDTDLDAELEMVQLHVACVTSLSKLFAREMADRSDGSILNTASVAGFAPTPTAAVYSATKHYVLAFSEALAGELADDGVTVTALCPGETKTGFFDRGNVGEAAFADGDLMDPEAVAAAGYAGLQRGDRVVVPGVKNKFRLFVKRLLPRAVYARASGRTWNE